MVGDSIGERIVWAREQAGLNKNRFARELGTSWQHVDHWEKGRTEPSVQSIRRIADVLGVSADFLLGVSAEPEPAPASGLSQFLAELAPDDLSSEEEQWLRGAPVDHARASAEDYVQLLEELRRISHRKAPPKSGKRRKVEKEAVAKAIRDNERCG